MLVVVDQRAAMGSSARARCDLAMMAAERVNGWCTAKQQMEVGTQHLPPDVTDEPCGASGYAPASGVLGYHRRSTSEQCDNPAFSRPAPFVDDSC